MSTSKIKTHHDPVIIPRNAHCVSRKDINASALKVLYRLKDANYEAYLVGGGVRDLILGRRPKDFDVATDAHPDEAHKEFRNSRLIGRRFRLLHVRFGREIIEVATFRAHHDEDSDHGEQHSHILDGMIVRDNVYGDLEDDAWRRDFTINALYYNIRDYSVIDYTGGMSDIENRLIRVIGDPAKRYTEDPVRMLRAVRFAAKLGFSIEQQSQQAIAELKEKLTAVPPARLFDETLKLFLSGHAAASLEHLCQNDLFQYLFPLTDVGLQQNDSFKTFAKIGLANTDLRIAQDKPVTPAFLFAIFLWNSVESLAQRLQQQGMSELQAMQAAGSDILSKQAKHVALPKRFSLQVRDIWGLQVRLKNRRGKRAYRYLSLPRFRAGYDFLLLRHQAGHHSDEIDFGELCDWWTRFQEEQDVGRDEMVQSLKHEKSSDKRSSRRRRKKRPPAES